MKSGTSVCLKAIVRVDLCDDTHDHCDVYPLLSIQQRTL